MVFIKTEGKFNDNSYLIDAEMFKTKGMLSIYVIENEGMRMMIDTGEALTARKIIKKLKDFQIFPIHKILLTHSHVDHIQGVHRLKKFMKETQIEILASENAINDLKNPERLNTYFGFNFDPIEDVIPLKEGDVIDLNGLKLKIYNFFGHTQDSIAIFDEKNKNIFVGDAIIDQSDYNTFNPVLFGPDFNEEQLLKTYDKLRDIKDLNSISLGHFGVWEGQDCNKILNEMEELYFKTKNSLIKWYNENNSLDDIALKYHETFIPNSKENIMVLKWLIEMSLDCLKAIGYIS